MMSMPGHPGVLTRRCRVEFSDAREKKDKAIALLQAAAGRLSSGAVEDPIKTNGRQAKRMHVGAPPARGCG